MDPGVPGWFKLYERTCVAASEGRQMVSFDKVMEGKSINYTAPK